MTRLLHAMALVMLLTASLPGQAAGGIALGQTRVIFSATDRAQSITVRNSGEGAFLIQARVQANPDEGAAAPFLVTPPLHSLKGGSRQLLRILRQDATLPADRESLFYLSVIAIPAHSVPLTARDRVSVGVRFVVKLFYRPAGIRSSAPEIACRLFFRRAVDGVRIDNPTAYYQTLGRLTINGQKVALAQHPVMVPPLAHLIVPAGKVPNALTWQTVTDAGGLSTPCNQAVAVH
ncbi:molecular chaperone [Serratia marcescens]|nr:molecular chaperone [Serratia marcescens]